MIDREAFEKTLFSPIDYWGGKRKTVVRSLIGNEVARMVGYNQNNPHHCYDLFAHSLFTVLNVGNHSSMALKAAAFFMTLGNLMWLEQNEEDWYSMGMRRNPKRYPGVSFNRWDTRYQT